jgi:16S rRNA (cytosine967-C5)-methyltransferase
VRSNKGFANAMLRHVAQAVDLRTADPAKPTTELALGPRRTLVLPQPLPDHEVQRLAIVHSLPVELAARLAVQHGEPGLRQIAAAASATPGVFLRATAGVERPVLRVELESAGVVTEPSEHPHLLRWTGGASPFGTPSYDAGHFVVQDPTALAAVEAVPCGPGDVVVDLCAAPGTKTTWLAERVRPGGRVHAFDPSPGRRRRIVDNVERLRLGDTVEVVADTAALPEADHVLADVPCSNTGVLGRRVEVRRRLTAGAFAPLVALQRELLTRAIALARPGGTVVYATCSIDRSENEQLVAAVLADPDVRPCELLTGCLTLPLAGQHDGGYHAVLRRG